MSLGQRFVFFVQKWHPTNLEKDLIMAASSSNFFLSFCLRGTKNEIFMLKISGGGGC